MSDSGAVWGNITVQGVQVNVWMTQTLLFMSWSSQKLNISGPYGTPSCSACKQPLKSPFKWKLIGILWQKRDPMKKRPQEKRHRPLNMTQMHFSFFSCCRRGKGPKDLKSLHSYSTVRVIRSGRSQQTWVKFIRHASEKKEWDKHYNHCDHYFYYCLCVRRRTLVWSRQRDF